MISKDETIVQTNDPETIKLLHITSVRYFGLGMLLSSIGMPIVAYGFLGVFSYDIKDGVFGWIIFCFIFNLITNVRADSKYRYNDSQNKNLLGVMPPQTPLHKDAPPPPSKKNQYTNFDEDAAYVQALNELESGTPEKAIWARAFAETDGADAETRALYIKRRVERLRSLEKPQNIDEKAEQEEEPGSDSRDTETILDNKSIVNSEILNKLNKKTSQNDWIDFDTESECEQALQSIGYSLTVAPERFTIHYRNGTGREYAYNFEALKGMVNRLVWSHRVDNENGFLECGRR